MTTDYILEEPPGVFLHVSLADSNSWASYISCTNAEYNAWKARENNFTSNQDAYLQRAIELVEQKLVARYYDSGQQFSYPTAEAWIEDKEIHVYLDARVKNPPSMTNFAWRQIITFYIEVDATTNLTADTITAYYDDMYDLSYEIVESNYN